MQSNTGKGAMYLLQIVLTHSPFPSINLQMHFVAMDFEKQCIFLMPHPPKSFGIEIFFHETQWKLFFSLLSAKRNFKLNFLTYSKTPFKIKVEGAQYTRNASNIELTSTKLPP